MRIPNQSHYLRNYTPAPPFTQKQPKLDISRLFSGQGRGKCEFTQMLKLIQGSYLVRNSF